MKILSFLRSKLGLAVNHAADRCFAYALATNIAPMPSSGEWLPLPEYGDVDYPVATKGGGVRKMIQRFTPAQAAKMQQRLQAVHAREGADFRGLPIYVGHPPADSKRWPDERRLGHVLEIDADPARARVRVALNELGRQNQAQGFWVYPSPGWNYSEAEANRTGVILPDELHHIGMTNDPRMTTAKPWTNSAGESAECGVRSAECDQPELAVNGDVAGHEFHGNQFTDGLGGVEVKHRPDIWDSEGKRKMNDGEFKEHLEKQASQKKARGEADEYVAKHHAPTFGTTAKGATAMGDNHTTATNTNDPHMNHKEILLKLLGLPETATDEEIQAAADKLAEAAESKKTALTEAESTTKKAEQEKLAANTARDDAQRTAEKFRTLAINSALATAINGRKISAAEQKEWEQKLATNFDEASGQLAAKAAALPNEALKLTKRADDISTPQGRQLAFNARITALTLPVAQGGQGLSIDDAITAMRADVNDAELLKAMQPAK